jgi:drug/metabolite transporter (DMT)-like permease
MPFYVFAWIADCLYGLSSITGKLSSKHQLRNPWQLNFIWGTLSCILILPFAIWYGVRLPVHWGPLLVFGIVSSISGTLYILSLNNLDISVLAPLYSFRPVFSVLLGYVLFHEQLTVTQLALTGVIIVAGLFASMDEHLSLRSFFHKFIVLALVAVFCSAIQGAATKYALEYEGFWEVTLWGSVLSMVPILLTVPLFWKDLRKTPIRKYNVLLTTVVISTLGFFAANKAYAINVGITSVIMSVPTSMLMAFLFSVFAPKILEKHSKKVYLIRFSATAIMVLAALRLSA